MQIANEFGNYKGAFLALLIIFKRIILMIINKWVVAIKCYLDGKDDFWHNGHISHFISSIDVVGHWEMGKFGYKFPKMETMLSMSMYHPSTMVHSWVLVHSCHLKGVMLFWNVLIIYYLTHDFHIWFYHPWLRLNLKKIYPRSLSWLYMLALGSSVGK